MRFNIINFIKILIIIITFEGNTLMTLSFTNPQQEVKLVLVLIDSTCSNGTFYIVNVHLNHVGKVCAPNSVEVKTRNLL